MTNRKILVFSRHGESPQKPEGGSLDSLVPETVIDIYERVGCPLQPFIAEQRITTGYLHHSPTVRTKYTGLAILAGALNLQPRDRENPPRCIEDLSQYDFAGIEMYEDPRLGFGKPFVNMKVYTANGAVSNRNVDYWLAHPEATEHDGEQIEPYQSVEARIRGAVKEAVQRLMSDDYDFGVLVTHAGLIEAVAAALIGTAQRVEKCDDIGGGFAMAQGAQLVIDTTAGGVYTARVERNGLQYAVNLDRLICE